MGGTIRWMRKNKMDVSHIKYDVFDTMEKDGVIVERPYKERYQALSKGIAEAATSPEIETIIVDGVTKLNSYIIGEIGRQKPMIGEKNPKQRREGEMSLADWNDHAYMFQNFVTKLQAIPKMFILCAHEEMSDRDDLPGQYLVSMQGKKIQATLPGMFSDVWRCEVDTVVRANGTTYEWKVRTMPTGQLALGCSLGLPALSVLTWEQIKAAIDSGFEEVK